MDQKSQNQLLLIGGAAVVAAVIYKLSKAKGWQGGQDGDSGTAGPANTLPMMSVRSASPPSNRLVPGGGMTPLLRRFIPDPADIKWVRINYNGADWDVSSDYIAPVSIGDGEVVAKFYGADVPTAGLVDAIWRAADLKLDPLPRKHDGTPKTMASQEAYNDQQARIVAQIAGRPFTLLAGTHKDIVRAPSGNLGIYGWQKSDGTNIQPLSTVHYPGWIDYSQGVRLARKVV